MDEDEYLKDRLDDQIDWYSKKSQTNQQWFKKLRLLEIVFATLIPFLAGIGDALPYYQIVIGGIGFVIAIAAGLSAINKYQENWIKTEGQVTKQRVRSRIANFEKQSMKQRISRSGLSITY